MSRRVYNHDRPEEPPRDRASWLKQINHAHIVGVVKAMSQRSREWYALTLEADVKPAEPAEDPPAFVWKLNPVTRFTIWVRRETFGRDLMEIVRFHLAHSQMIVLTVEAQLFNASRVFESTGLVQHGLVLIGQRVIWRVPIALSGDDPPTAYDFRDDDVSPPSPLTLGFLLDQQEE